MTDVVALGELLIDFAAAAASLSTEHSGGIPSIPEKDTVLRFMQDLCPL